MTDSDYGPERIAEARAVICAECGGEEASYQAASGLMRCDTCGAVSLEATGERLRAALDALERAQNEIKDLDSEIEDIFTSRRVALARAEAAEAVVKRLADRVAELEGRSGDG
jgi:ribosomal protein S27E